MSQPDYLRKRSQRQNRAFPGITGIAALAALLCGCGPSSSSTSLVTGSSAAPLTCKQQYQDWEAGPAKAGAQKVTADANALSSAGGDIPVMVGDLKALGADATAMQAYPMPACADPAGYWAQVLNSMKAAGDNAGSATGLAALVLAEAPLKQVPALQSKLAAELAKTIGAKMPAPASRPSVAAPALPTVAAATIPAPSPLPTLATVAPVAVPTPPPLPSLQPVPTEGT